jgi:histidyl-tRNA synthetase
LRLIKVGLISVSKSTVAKVIVTTAEGISENFSFYLQCAQMLRKANIATEVYMLDSKLGKQMEFANKRGFTLAIIAKAPNIETGTVVVRNLEIGDQKEVTLDQLIPTVLEMLN